MIKKQSVPSCKSVLGSKIGSFNVHLVSISCHQSSIKTKTSNNESIHHPIMRSQLLNSKRLLNPQLLNSRLHVKTSAASNHSQFGIVLTKSITVLNRSHYIYQCFFTQSISLSQSLLRIDVTKSIDHCFESLLLVLQRVQKR